LLAEYKYDGELDETFGLWQASKKPLGIFYYLKKKVFPFAYFHLMPRGIWYGRDFLFKSLKDVRGQRI